MFCSPAGERRTLAIHRTNCGVAILIVNPEDFPVKLDSTVMECEVADRTHGTHKMQTNSPGTSQALLDGVVAVIRQQVIADMQAAEAKSTPKTPQYRLLTAVQAGAE